MKCDTAILGRVVGLLLAILTPGVACATDAQLVGDTHISSSHPSANFGGLTNLHVGNGNTVLIQFDVQSVLPAGILSSQIAKADLVLYVNRVNNPGSLDLKAVTSPWSESAVTSNTAPSLGIVAVPPIAVSAANTYVTVDVTALVQGWVASPGSNNGISLSASTTIPATFVLFDSKENDQTGHQPRLEITLAGPQGPQGLTGTTGAQGIQGLSGATGATGPQGLTGLTGAVGPQGLQGPPATFKGAWSNATTYATGDAVSFNGSSYVSLVNPNLGNQPDTNPSQWGLLAQQGITGAIGATGATGAQGPIGLTGATGATGPQGLIGTAGAAAPTIWGDGSAGSVTVNSNEDWTGSSLPADAQNGNLQFVNFTVNSGVTLTIPSGLVVKATGTVTINGTIVVMPLTSFPASVGALQGISTRPANLALGGVGIPMMSAAQVLNPGSLGGGSGAGSIIAAGGGGGGNLVIRAQGGIVVGGSGSILVNGADGVTPSGGIGTSDSGGAGGGGGILILASQGNIVNNGTLSANGGNGGSGQGNTVNIFSGGAGGGGGIIHVLSPNASLVTGTLTVAAGATGSSSGSAGPQLISQGGGASGGSGGNGFSLTLGTTTTAGTGGYVIKTQVDPTALF